jgi:hypothetical protein
MNPKKTQAQPLAVDRLYIKPKIAGLTPSFSVAFRTICRILPKNVATQHYCASLIESCAEAQDYCVGAQEIDPSPVYGAKITPSRFMEQKPPVRFTG